jgi:hypothetical protein
LLFPRFNLNQVSFKCVSGSDPFHIDADRDLYPHQSDSATTVLQAFHGSILSLYAAI